MNRLKNLIKDRKGAFSILYVILIFIAVMVVTGFMDIITQSWTLNEVQSIMDTSGVSALRTGVDETKLRVGTFSVDKNIVKNNYINLVTSELSHSQKISEFHFVRTNVSTFNENWGVGVSSKTHPQALIDSTIVVVVDSSIVFDTIPGIANTYYDARSNGNFEVTYLGQTDDGKMELSIRSVSRIVYR